MSKYTVHDKFIIEIEECIKGYGNDPTEPDIFNLPVLHRIKGFNTLVFDEYGLDKLEKYEEEKYRPSELEIFKQEAFEAGMNEAWDIAKRIVGCHEKGFEETKRNAVFDRCDAYDVFNLFKAKEAKEKIEAWEKGDYKIRVGDVVETYDNSGVVLYLCSEDAFYVLTDNGCVETWDFADVVKTKKRFDIPSIISQLGGV